MAFSRRNCARNGEIDLEEMAKAKVQAPVYQWVSQKQAKCMEMEAIGGPALEMLAALHRVLKNENG